MAIPSLDEDGLLPVGIHDCTLAELREAFGQSRWVRSQPDSGREVLCQQRGMLCTRLEAYLDEIRRANIEAEILVNGSFVTDKPDPNDIDLIVVLPASHDFSREPSPREYNLLSKKRVRAGGFPFDILVVPGGSPEFATALALFQKVRDRANLAKGLLRVRP